VNIELKGKEFLPFPDEIIGKKIVLRDETILAEGDHVDALWQKVWEAAGAPKAR
jgi:hypothetical protein